MNACAEWARYAGPDKTLEICVDESLGAGDAYAVEPLPDMGFKTRGWRLEGAIDIQHLEASVDWAMRHTPAWAGHFVDIFSVLTFRSTIL